MLCLHKSLFRSLFFPCLLLSFFFSFLVLGHNSYATSYSSPDLSSYITNQTCFSLSSLDSSFDSSVFYGNSVFLKFSAFTSDSSSFVFKSVLYGSMSSCNPSSSVNGFRTSFPSGADLIYTGYFGTNYSIFFYVNLPSGVTLDSFIVSVSTEPFSSSSEPEVIYGDYHQDLIDIRTAIYVCGAILLVLYFFFCIYRMIITGVKR